MGCLSLDSSPEEGSCTGSLRKKQEPYETVLCPLSYAGKPVVAQTEGRASTNVQIGAQAQQGQKRRQIAGEAERADDAMQGEFLVLPVRVALQALQGQMFSHHLDATGGLTQGCVRRPGVATVKQGEGLDAA